jgi:hypothetical protein
MGDLIMNFDQTLRFYRVVCELWAAHIADKEPAQIFPTMLPVSIDEGGIPRARGGDSRQLRSIL